MESFGFYSFTDHAQGVSMNGCSKESKERPLVINCAGCFRTTSAFTTENEQGRLDYYLIYINTGALTFYDGDETHLATEGSVVMIPAGITYKYVFSGERELAYYWVHFTGSEAQNRLSEYGIAPFPRVMRTYTANRIVQRYGGVFDAFERQDAYRDRELSAMLERLLIAVARGLEKEKKEANPFSRSLGYLMANYNTDVRIPTLAAMEHLSTSRYNFLFKEKMGVSPKGYLLQLRMSSAAELLAATDFQVKEIGLMCGYKDAHFFCKTFRSYFNVSPTEYRQGRRG